MRDLPIIRSHERIDYKRCPKKWYWKWRRGLVPRAKQFGALELGTWVHAALAQWYGLKRGGRGTTPLYLLFIAVAEADIFIAKEAGAPDYLIEKADELLALGTEMLSAYERHYGADKSTHVIQAELPLEFSISDPLRANRILAIHRLKPDLVYADDSGDVWLMEHKTAATIRTEHLVIDDQARPYGSMAELSMRKLGLLKRGQRFRGIMYNFLRKALPDLRETNAQGFYLNKSNGTVSKKQPPPYFKRVPVEMTKQAKLIALRRIQQEVAIITAMTELVRRKEIDPLVIPKTPHNSCPKTCQFFTMCVQEEQGVDIRLMQRAEFVVQDPYVYDEDTTTEPASFEMG